MRLSLLVVVVAAALSCAAAASPPAGGKMPLTPDFYKQTCPRAERIIAEVIQSKQMENPTTAAGVLRVFFHDCFVGGCERLRADRVQPVSPSPSTMRRSTSLFRATPSTPWSRAKLALEMECPGVVSCADILFTGLGRAGHADGRAPLPGFSVQELVALSGAHTLGFSHCKEFADRIFNYRDKKDGKPEPFDPTMNPSFARGLQGACKDYLKDPTIAAFNDIMTPGKFDNMYFINLERGLGLLDTDEELWTDPRTKPFVQLYASNSTKFFDDFGRAMEKLSLLGVKTGAEGEIRRRCDTYNHGPNMPTN
ncbi:hypothetical protein PR202_ga02688 [Eleusine coracana subsp. coracana]|uniref:Peroxidase n=1 Tax=Eleusine coracana subsp. coracana TaxID=191504 RepID=A0AAV5BKQ9_ELECO|nr:hypothetical protein PR202_ga02688 [Eleusine coracana subsp. coracana]